MPSGTRDVYLSAASLRAPSGADPYRLLPQPAVERSETTETANFDLLLPNFRGGLARSPYPR